MDLAVGQVYGEKYRIVRLLGQGSMGAVYEGENIRIRRKVAIKTLHAGVAEKGDTLQRFEREAQAAGRIGSEHIVEVLDMGDLPDGSRFMVMEHLEGATLAQHIRARGRLTPGEASPILQQLLQGLAAAHAAGIIHRDLKPANVFLVRAAGKPDFVKILDFGVSKFSVLSEEMSMTRTGAVLGTPYYMSPEQAKGSRGTDARSDVYAVGVILYECITGQVPFSAETFNELLFRIVLESPPPPESFVPDLPPEFAAIIRKAMAREPAERFQSAEELRQVLADWSAKADAAPAFDGLLTLDAQTVMRMSPLHPAALRPAPPSTTASGVMVMDGAAAAAAPPVAALGTVIIDPAVVPDGGAPGASGAPNGVPRSPHKTEPLPQWGTPGMPATAAPPVPGRQSIPGPLPVPAGWTPSPAPAGAPGEGRRMPSIPDGRMPSMPDGRMPSMPDGRMPSMPDGLNPQAPITFTEASPRSLQRPARRPMRGMAFIGIATGLLLGVAAWAVLWRGDDDGAGATGESAIPASSPPPAAAEPAAPAATEPATPAAAEPAADPATPPAEPAGGASPPAATSPAAVEPEPAPKPAKTATGAGTAASPGTAKSAATAPPAASSAGAATVKPGEKKPSGGRTVSQDL